MGGIVTLMSRNALASTSPRTEKSTRCFGTDVRITICGVSRRTAEKAIAAAFHELTHIEQVMSIYQSDSQIARLNRDGRLVSPDPVLVEILRTAERFSMETQAAFDVTVQPLWDVFNMAKQEQRLPDRRSIALAKRQVGFKRVVVRDNEITLRNGARLTLNGIAQGFATDRARQCLLDHGIEHAMLDIGELAALGNKQAEQPWKVGIEHPRNEDAYAAVVSLDDRCLATSGDYHTSFSDDLLFHHIFDPRTGRSPTELSSVSVLAPSATEADALSTALMVMGIERGTRLLAGKSNVDAMFVQKDGRTLVTSGFPQGASR